MPRLIENGKRGGLELRTATLIALGSFGHDAVAALPLIYDAFRDSEADVRGAAAQALAAVETDEAKILAALLPGVKDENGRVRRPTAHALAKFGAHAREAAPAIVAMLERETDRPIALESLRAIGVRSTPDLLRALGVKDPAVRIFACGQLEAMGAEAHDAIPKLKELLNGQPAPVQEAAKAALSKIDPQP